LPVAFALDQQRHPLTIDMGNLQVDPFRNPQPARIDRFQAGAIDRVLDFIQNAADFLTAQNGRQFFLKGRPDQFQREPLAAQRLLEQKLHPTQRNRRCGTGNLLLTCEIQKILAQVLLIELIRTSMKVPRQLPDGIRIKSLRTCGKPTQAHILDHPLT
jgi:hypothetical protein